MGRERLAPLFFKIILSGLLILYFLLDEDYTKKQFAAAALVFITVSTGLYNRYKEKYD